MELPASEIHGWMEFFATYPFTQDREDARAALISQTIAVAFTGKKHDIKEFLPDYLDTVSGKKTDEQRRRESERFAQQLMKLNETLYDNPT